MPATHILNMSGKICSRVESEVRYFYDDETKLCTKKTDTGYCDEEYEYDAKGNMTKSVNQLGTTVYEYDDAGNWTVRIINGVVKLNRKIEYYPMANDHSM